MIGLVEKHAEYLKNEPLNIGSEGFANTNQKSYSKTVEVLDSQLNDKNKITSSPLSINRYLLMITKLENDVKSKASNLADIDLAVYEIAARIKKFSAREIKILEKNTDYLKLGFVDASSSTTSLKNFLTAQLDSPDSQAKIFAFLKSRPVISLLKGEPQKNEVYHKNENTNANLFSNKAINFNRYTSTTRQTGVAGYQHNLKLAHI